MRRQHGFSLIELLVAASLLIVVISVALLALERFNITSQRAGDQNDAQAAARNALDLMVRQMRNHAAPAPDQQVGIDKAGAYDVVFQTVDTAKPAGSANVKNVRRVRYCLDAGTPANERIWFQSQTWTTATTPPVPSTASCPDPDPAWNGGAAQVIVDHLTNQLPATPRPLFIPDACPGAAACTAQQIKHISQLVTQLFVDRDPTRSPPEQELDSTVAFRNENQAPNATFTYLVNANGSVVLNATGSADPEGDPLTYTWADSGTPIGQGLAFTWENPGSGNHTVTLTVTDGSGLSDSSTATVTVP